MPLRKSIVEKEKSRNSARCLTLVPRILTATYKNYLKIPKMWSLWSLLEKIFPQLICINLQIDNYLKALQVPNSQPSLWKKKILVSALGCMGFSTAEVISIDIEKRVWRTICAWNPFKEKEPSIFHNQATIPLDISWLSLSRGVLIFFSPIVQGWVIFFCQLPTFSEDLNYFTLCSSILASKFNSPHIPIQTL